MEKKIVERQAKEEQRILAEIQKNARETFSIIAKHCGFSRQKTLQLIKRMENDKNIWGYTAIEDGAI